MKPLLLFLLLGAAVPVLATEIRLPPETAQFKPSTLPGYALVQRNCMTCHSVHYVETQPTASPRAYWEATVKKMKHPFGAQFPDKDVSAMVEYLVRTYGGERDSRAPTMAKASTAVPTAKPAAAKADTAVLGAKALLASNNCMGCHSTDKTVVGPGFKAVAAKYSRVAGAEAAVAKSIRAGGAGKWGPVPMPPYGGLSEEQGRSLARYVLSQ